MKKRKLIFLLPIAAMALGACGKNSSDDNGSVNPGGEGQQEDGVKIEIVNGEPFSLKVGETQKLTVSVSGTQASPTWSSTNTNVATVSADGTVTAIGEGKADIVVMVDEDHIDSVQVTVTKQEEERKTEHEGTLDDPFDGADANLIANDLNPGGVTADSYYIKGKVQKLEETFNPSFGNYSFSIEDGFICWRLKKGSTAANFNEGDIEVGDEVVVYAQIQKFVKEGEQPKPETKGGYVVSVKKKDQPTVTEILEVASAPEEVEQGASIDPSSVTLKVKLSDDTEKTVSAQQVIADTSAAGQITATAKYESFEKTFTITVVAAVPTTHAGTQADPFDGADANIVANRLPSGGATTDSYYIKGTVQQFEENFDSSFGNYSFSIEGGFICWRLKNGENQAKFAAGDIELGDEVVVYAQIQKYVKDGEQPKPETKGGYVVSVTKPSVSSVNSVASGHPTSVQQDGQIKAGDVTLNVTLSNGKPSTVLATRVECDTSAPGQNILATAYYEVEGKVVGSATFAVEVIAKEVYEAVSYTFVGGTSALNMASWDSEEFMKHVSSEDDVNIITGISGTPSYAYIGGNGGSGATAWNIWNCLKVGKTDNKGEVTLTLDPTATFSKIKMHVIGARDDGNLTVNGITKDVTKKANPNDLEPIVLDYDISENTGSLKLSSKEGSGNFSICITKIEFVDGYVPAPVPVLDSLEVTKAPDKVDYYVGDNFDPTGMVVTAKYTHGGQDKILEAEEYTVDKTALSLKDTFVTVSYTEDEITKTVQVPVTVTKAPVPVTGVTLNKTELSMKVNEADFTLEATVAPAEADDPTVTWSLSKEGVVTVNNGVLHAVADGEVTVTATAGDFHADCVVTVAPADKVLSGIEVTTQPAKTEYVAGESFDPTDMVVTASYSSGHNPEPVTGYTFSTAPLTEANTTVEIDYNGQKAYVTITVSPAPVLDSISVANAQGKTAEYTVGDVISKDDIVVTAHYTQGKQDAVVTDYTISKTTALAVEDTSVTITYVEGGVEKTTAYNFTVNPLPHVNTVQAAYEVGKNQSSGYSSAMTMRGEVTSKFVNGTNNVCFIQDGDYSVYVFKISAGDFGKFDVGDEISFSAQMTQYNGTIEATSIQNLVKETTDEIETPVAKELTSKAELDATGQGVLVKATVSYKDALTGWNGTTSKNPKVTLGGQDITLNLNKSVYNATEAAKLAELKSGDEFEISNCYVGIYNGVLQMCATERFEVNKVVRNVTSIELGGDMTKKEYGPGDSWDYAGITCTAELDNGSHTQLSFSQLTVTSLSADAPAEGVTSLTINVKVTAYPDVTGSITINNIVYDASHVDVEPYEATFATVASGGATGGNSSYTGSYTYNNLDGISWVFEGNTTTAVPKLSSGTANSTADRSIYCINGFTDYIKNVDFIISSVDSAATVNSIQLTIYGSESDVKNGTNAVATISGTISDGKVSFVVPSGLSVSQMFIKVTFNLTNTTKNKGVCVSGVKVTF